MPTTISERSRSLLALAGAIAIAGCANTPFARFASSQSPPEQQFQSSYALEVPAGGANMFALDDLASYRKYSRLSNFEIVGHSYLRGLWITANGQGMAINTMAICGKTAYLAGYNPFVFGALIVDIGDPQNMRPLSFIPGHPGTRNAYLRVSCARKILALGHSADASNPAKPPAGAPPVTGVTFHDVSDPRNPKPLGDWKNAGGRTRGMEMDDKYVYVCGSSADSKPNIQVEELNIVNYANPAAPKLIARFHVKGQHKGEVFDPLKRKNPDGTDQLITCDEINKDGSRLYVAYRDAGLVILDVSNPAKPVRIDGGFDYSPPYNGDPGLPKPGCCPGAHTALPAPHELTPLPHLVVMTDEHFSCPPGFGRILDVTDEKHVTLLSTYHIHGVDDQYDFTKHAFVCPPAQESTHLPFFDARSHGSLFYQAWYNQGLRAIDISNPFEPREVGYYISPNFSLPSQAGRHTREPYFDPATNLIYVTDGNGGGLTVLRYTGPMPANPPIPGVR